MNLKGFFNGAPVWIRTTDLPLRRRVPEFYKDRKLLLIKDLKAKGAWLFVVIWEHFWESCSQIVPNFSEELNYCFVAS